MNTEIWKRTIVLVVMGVPGSLKDMKMCLGYGEYHSFYRVRSGGVDAQMINKKIQWMGRWGN